MDWSNSMPHALHSTTFKWNPKEPVLPIYKDLVEEKAKAPAPSVPEKKKSPAAKAIDDDSIKIDKSNLPDSAIKPLCIEVSINTN